MVNCRRPSRSLQSFCWAPQQHKQHLADIVAVVHSFSLYIAQNVTAERLNLLAVILYQFHRRGRHHAPQKRLQPDTLFWRLFLYNIIIIYEWWIIIIFVDGGPWKRSKVVGACGLSFFYCYGLSVVSGCYYGVILYYYIGQRTSHIYRACRPLIASAAAAVYIFMLWDGLLGTAFAPAELCLYTFVQRLVHHDSTRLQQKRQSNSISPVVTGVVLCLLDSPSSSKYITRRAIT
jgi:hypothetical protein